MILELRNLLLDISLLRRDATEFLTRTTWRVMVGKVYGPLVQFISRW